MVGRLLVLRLQLICMCRMSCVDAGARSWGAIPEHTRRLRLIVGILIVTEIIRARLGIFHERRCHHEIATCVLNVLWVIVVSI